MRTYCRRMRNIIFLAAMLILGSIVLMKSTEVSADDRNNTDITVENNDISMTIDYGFDHYVKYGRYMGVSAVIHNNGDQFEGWLQIIVPKIEKNVVYRVKVEIPPASTKKVSLPIPVSDDSGHLLVKLINENKKTVLETNAKIEIGNKDDQVYIGILSEASENLSYLNTYVSKAFYMDESNFPDDYLELDNLDAIVVNQFDTDKLSVKQLEAIVKWVKRGGLLVIGTGEFYEKTLATLGSLYSVNILENNEKNIIDLHIDENSVEQMKRFILGYAEERKWMLEIIQQRNKMLESYGKEPIAIDNILPDQWAEKRIASLKPESVQKQFANVSLDGGMISGKESNYYVYQKRPVGNGMVMLYSINIGIEQENASICTEILVSIIGSLSSYKREQMQGEYYGSHIDNQIYKGMLHTDAKSVPKVSCYLIILVVYILLVGPVSFFILKKLDKISYTWITVPVLALLFICAIYIFGSNSRISRPYVGYINILTYQDDNRVEDEMYFSLTSPNNHKVSIDIDSKYAVREYNSNLYSFYMEDIKFNKKVNLERYTTAINYGLDRTELEVNKNPAFSPVYYQTRFTEFHENKLSYELKYTGSKITGSITNGFNYDLNDAFLLCDGNLIQLGTIDKGQTVTVDNKTSLFLASRDVFYNNDIINNITGVDSNNTYNSPETNRKLSILSYLGNSKLLNIGDGNYVVAFPENDNGKEQAMPGDSLIDDLLKKADCYGMNIAMFPIQPDYTENSRTFVPSIDPYIKSNDIYYDSYYSPRYLSTNDKNVQYHFPGDDHIVSFLLLPERNPSFESDSQQDFEGKIYFLNLKTGNYDEVFRTGVGSKVTNVTDYLTEENILTVRYSSNASLQASQMLLPYISYFKEQSLSN